MLPDKKMEWKKIAESNDLIVFEKKGKRVDIRIEARREKGSSWNVYKTYLIRGDKNYVEEYKAQGRHQLRQLLDYLSKGKEPTVSQLGMKARLQRTEPMLDFRRVYKEEYVEKWEFSFNKEGFVNFLLVRFDSTLDIDIVMDRRYKVMEKAIIRKITEFLGIKEVIAPSRIRVYYYCHYAEFRREGEEEEADFFSVA